MEIGAYILKHAGKAAMSLAMATVASMMTDKAKTLFIPIVKGAIKG